MPITVKTTKDSPKAKAGNRDNGLSRHLILVWLVSLAVMIPILLVLAYLGWGVLLLSGAGSVLANREAVLSLLFGLLLVDLAIASLITVVYAIPAWIFQAPATGKVVPDSWVDAVRRGEAQSSPQRLLWPLYGLGCLPLSIALSIVWVLDADFIYQHWTIAQYTPYVTTFLFIGGASQLIWAYLRRPKKLARMGWRLRLVSALIAACMIPGVLKVPEGAQTCSGHPVERLIEVQNLGAFRDYLATHPTCRGAQLDDVLFKLLKLGPLGGFYDDPLVENENWRVAFMGVLMDKNIEITPGDWERLLDDKDLLAVLLQALAKNPEHPAFSANVLGQRLAEFVGNNDLASLKIFFEAGLRLDQGDWIAYAPHLRYRALDQKPAWPIYDALIAAGLTEKPEVSRLIKAVRQGDLTPVVDWRQADWMKEPEPEDYPGRSLLALAILYTDDEPLRQQFLAAAGLSATDLLARTPLPTRCAFAEHLGADRVLASLNDADDPYQRARCADYMEALIREEKAESGRIR